MIFDRLGVLNVFWLTIFQLMMGLLGCNSIVS